MIRPPRLPESLPEQEIVLDKYDFGWDKQAVKQAIRLWNKGYEWRDIVDAVRPADKRRPNRSFLQRDKETRLLFLHLFWEGKIRDRIGNFGD